MGKAEFLPQRRRAEVPGPHVADSGLFDGGQAGAHGDGAVDRFADAIGRWATR